METAADLDHGVAAVRRARNLRRAGIAALAALIGAGVLGAFDPGEAAVSEAGGGFELEAEFPDRARGGLDSPLTISVTRPGGFDGPITLAVSRDWLDLFDQSGIEPEPDASTADGGRVIWEFESPPGGELEVSVEMALRPAVRTGGSGRVALLDGDREIVAVEVKTSVVP